MRLIRAIALLLLLPLGSDALAQQVVPGDRVRLTVPSLFLMRAEAVVQDTSRESMTVIIDDENRSRTLAWATITALDIHAGRRSGLKKGLAIGAITGAVLGFIAGSDGGDLDPDGAPFLGALLVGTAGGVIGLAIGATRSRDIWEPVTIRGQSALAYPSTGARDIPPVELIFVLPGGDFR